MNLYITMSDDVQSRWPLIDRSCKQFKASLHMHLEYVSNGLIHTSP